MVGGDACFNLVLQLFEDDEDAQPGKFEQWLDRIIRVKSWKVFL